MTAGPVVSMHVFFQATSIWLQVAEHLQAHLPGVELQSHCKSFENADTTSLPFISAPLTYYTRRMCRHLRAVPRAH